VATELKSTDDETAAVTRDQDRTRQNISSLNSVSGQQQQVQTYARQLADLEARVTKLRDRHSELEKQKAALQAQVNAAIEKMNF